MIVAKIKPGAEEDVAKLFAESDESELPRMAGVRHRSLFVLDDIYIHYVETDDDFAEAVDAVRDHPLFREISKRLDDFITPYDPETWKSPKDAQAREFYSWDPPDAGALAGKRLRACRESAATVSISGSIFRTSPPRTRPGPELEDGRNRSPASV